MTSPLLPDLVQLSAQPETTPKPSPLTLLEAYRQVLGMHPEYRERYWAQARQLEATEANNVSVLEALADWSLQKKTSEGTTAALEYLNRAIEKGSSNPADFEQLANLFINARRYAQAVSVLKKGIALIPYDPELYELLVKAHVELNQKQEACGLLERALRNFPQRSALRDMQNGCPSEAATDQK